MEDREELRMFELRDGDVCERMITAAGGADLAELFSSVARATAHGGGRLLHERIFLTGGDTETVLAARKAAYGDLDDGVMPTLLRAGGLAETPVVGVQIHAVTGGTRPHALTVGDQALGRTWRCGSAGIISGCGIAPCSAGPAESQARQMLETARRVLEAGGATPHDLARTWMWLGDILDWYDGFNAVRNDLFAQWGLLGRSRHLPASTGIGVGPAGGRACAIDFVALTGTAAIQRVLEVGGRQRSAFDYGSAFSRGVLAVTPAGATAYVSGTAAIDTAGHTECLNDAEGQIERTIRYARAILADCGCDDRHVVSAMIYCKTPDVLSVFESHPSRPDWPSVTMVADVCRDDLLFEVEATACRDRVQ